jgi:hypothetical protein
MTAPLLKGIIVSPPIITLPQEKIDGKAERTIIKINGKNLDELDSLS